jgi:hypothetical protein
MSTTSAIGGEIVAPPTPDAPRMSLTEAVKMALDRYAAALDYVRHHTTAPNHLRHAPIPSTTTP